ncbi:MAG: hypothetical protein WAQ05_18360 [Rubrivivax sp.]
MSVVVFTSTPHCHHADFEMTRDQAGEAELAGLGELLHGAAVAAWATWAMCGSSFPMPGCFFNHLGVGLPFGAGAKHDLVQQLAGVVPHPASLA